MVIKIYSPKGLYEKYMLLILDILMHLQENCYKGGTEIACILKGSYSSIISICCLNTDMSVSSNSYKVKVLDMYLTTDPMTTAIYLFLEYCNMNGK